MANVRAPSGQRSAAECALVGVVGQASGQLVGNDVDRVHAHSTSLGDAGAHVLPDAADIGANLFAVGVAHVVQGIHLAGALVGAAHRTYQLHLHVQFVQQVFVEHHLAADAAEVHHTLRVKVDEVGGGG